jgi:hypothetical protein
MSNRKQVLPFNIKRPCKKCGHKGRMIDDVLFRPAATVFYNEQEDLLVRTCRLCKYVWLEECIDNV